MHSSDDTSARIGYVLKKYPRLSETFILNEILGLEAAGVDVAVYSLCLPDDGRFHAEVAQVNAAVRYLPPFGGDAVMSGFRALRSTSGLSPDALEQILDFVDLLPPERRTATLIQALNLSALVERDGITHLHAHFMSVAAHVAHLTSVLTGIPFTVTAHAKDIYRHTVDATLFRSVARRARAVITVCDATRRHVADQLAPDGRVVRVYNGLPLAELGDRCAARDGRLVLAVGRLVEKKGFDVLLRAMPALLRQHGDIRCVIVGDGEDAIRLQNLSAQLGLDHSVEFVGSLARHHVLELMCRASVLAAPFVTGADGNRDALPTVLLEAMAMGLPVVATPLGGVPEIVQHERNGLLVAERDHVAFADAVSRLLDDTLLRDRLATAAMARVASTFDQTSTLRQSSAVFGVEPSQLPCPDVRTATLA